MYFFVLIAKYVDVTRHVTSLMFYYFVFWCLDWINAVVRFCDKCLQKHLFKLKLFCIR